MEPQVKTKLTSLYDEDYQRWLDETVAQLKAQDFSSLDLENLIEEIESLGRSDKRAISSYLMRLCEHFLKLRYWKSEREMCFRGWDLEITNFRLQIQAILEDSPSLKNYLNDQFLSAYGNARKLFLKASQLESQEVPDEPEFSLEQALDEDWLPWSPESSSHS
ncbi:DUF29 domain-containing protein [Synechococcus sp. PCC 6717]|jgi:hypothetical protein|uniref:DUF29 domain-containing protein n=1 Tax=Parathermosynechococcus lividus PCC 6715 TaxID=1917166 RepID=A0A2D2Q4D8_PARLV|nr:DUF29 domain-containing protein [Thermostichus lividus]ATS19394.1 hypothetical protein BRW62_12370 [Thermostichus lividus PCC 6715]MCI3280300.1 DUF29 domain-containing protein [Synechococcus sp. PCC 6717]